MTGWCSSTARSGAESADAFFFVIIGVVVVIIVQQQRRDAKAALALLRQERERQERERVIELDPSAIERGGEKEGTFMNDGESRAVASGSIRPKVTGLPLLLGDRRPLVHADRRLR